MKTLLVDLQKGTTKGIVLKKLKKALPIASCSFDDRFVHMCLSCCCHELQLLICTTNNVHGKEILSSTLIKLTTTCHPSEIALVIVLQTQSRSRPCPILSFSHLQKRRTKRLMLSVQGPSLHKLDKMRFPNIPNSCFPRPLIPPTSTDFH